MTIAIPYHSSPRGCPCGCGETYTFSYEGDDAPPREARLYYRCPQSGDLLSFHENGSWAHPAAAPCFEVVTVSLGSDL